MITVNLLAAALVVVIGASAAYGTALYLYNRAQKRAKQGTKKLEDFIFKNSQTIYEYSYPTSLVTEVVIYNSETDELDVVSPYYAEVVTKTSPRYIILGLL